VHVADARPRAMHLHHLDQAYAPPLAIDREPSTTTASTPAIPARRVAGMVPARLDGTSWNLHVQRRRYPAGGASLNPSKWTSS